MRTLRTLVIATALAMAAPAFAQEIRQETVRFAPGTSGTTIRGSIKGDHGARYSLRVRAGQKMSVQLDTSNASNYFNITAPNANEALFIGSTEGNGASLAVPTSGDYVIDVYLMRNAARRGETAKYELTIHVE